jgi:hypothetical protein
LKYFEKSRCCNPPKKAKKYEDVSARSLGKMLGKMAIEGEDFTAEEVKAGVEEHTAVLSAEDTH